MTSNVIFSNPSMRLSEVAKLMVDNDIGILPVQDDTGQIVGIVTDRDITCRAIAQNMNPAITPVDKVMSQDVISCTEDEDIEDAAHLMEDKQVRRLPVQNSKSETTGILALADVSRATSHELSGEIIHEISKAESRVHKQVSSGS
jgi:CBS domain-containing protein